MQATYLSLVRGEPAKAFDIQSKAAAARKNPVEAYALARLGQELGREDELPALCGLLREHAEYSLFAAYQIGRDLVRRNKTVAAAAAEACLGTAERYKPLIMDLLADPTMSSPVQPARHIAICGTSYCGSTLLDRLLNGMDGAHSIGESHWLTKGYDGKRAIALDFLDPLNRFVPQCSVCGRKCEVLTPRFRAALAADPKDWYFKIAARLGARTLISADKNLPKLVLNDPQLRGDALILFKSPKQAWASELSKRRPGESEDELFDQMRRYMTVWRLAYAEMLENFKPQGAKVFANFDYLTRNPGPILRSIACRFSLSFEERALQQSIPGHSIGGNTGSMRRLRESNYAVRIEKLEASAIPADHAAWIDGSPDINALYHALNERMIDGLSMYPTRSSETVAKSEFMPVAQAPVVVPQPANSRIAESAAGAARSPEPSASSTEKPTPPAVPQAAPVRVAEAGAVSPAPPQPSASSVENPSPASQETKTAAMLDQNPSPPGEAAGPAGKPALALPIFPIPTIPDQWLEGIFQDFEQQMRAAAAVNDTERKMFKLRRELFTYLADNFDSEAYAVLQRRHLVESEMPRKYNEVKYFDTVRWIGGKFSHATELGLHHSPPLDIVDLGTGPGHFQVVAEFMGHRTLGLDVPLTPRIASAPRHLYDDLCEYFRLKKLDFNIKALKPLPDLGQKFDMVTSFMTWFNAHPDGTPWSSEEWSFFLCDVRDRMLKPGGRLYMNLVKEALSPEVWFFLSTRATKAVERNRTVLFEDLSSFWTVSAAA